MITTSTWETSPPPKKTRDFNKYSASTNSSSPRLHTHITYICIWFMRFISLDFFLLKFQFQCHLAEKKRYKTTNAIKKLSIARVMSSSHFCLEIHTLKMYMALRDGWCDSVSFYMRLHFFLIILSSLLFFFYSPLKSDPNVCGVVAGSTDNSVRFSNKTNYISNF